MKYTYHDMNNDDALYVEAMTYSGLFHVMTKLINCTRNTW